MLSIVDVGFDLPAVQRNWEDVGIESHVRVPLSYLLLFTSTSNTQHPRPTHNIHMHHTTSICTIQHPHAPHNITTSVFHRPYILAIFRSLTICFGQDRALVYTSLWLLLVFIVSIILFNDVVGVCVTNLLSNSIHPVFFSCLKSVL